MIQETITYYQYKMGLHKYNRFPYILVLHQRFIQENAQAVYCDENFSIISKRN